MRCLAKIRDGRREIERDGKIYKTTWIYYWDWQPKACFTNPAWYIRARKETESWLQEEFISKGGSPQGKYPIYMTGQKLWVLPTVIPRKGVFKNFLESLNGNKHMVLATCSDRHVTARTISVINNGLKIFF